MENQKQYYNLLIAKKTEKLVTAIYLISQFLKDTENIKIEIRSESNKLLKNINLLAFNEQIDTHLLYRESLDIVSILISYLSVARDTNLISKMNTDIVIDSLRALESILIKKQFTLTKESLMILEEDLFLGLANEKKNDAVNKNTSFDVLTERNVKYKSDSVPSNVSKNTSKDVSVKIEEVEIKPIKDKIYKGQSVSIKDKKDTEKENNNLNIKNKVSIPNNKSKQNKDRKENRRDQILGLFSKGVEVSINDISKKIVGCSVKTIQRELNDLVNEDKLKKIGDKRWSRYILNY